MSKQWKSVVCVCVCVCVCRWWRAGLRSAYDAAISHCSPHSATHQDKSLESKQGNKLWKTINIIYSKPNFKMFLAAYTAQYMWILLTMRVTHRYLALFGYVYTCLLIYHPLWYGMVLYGLVWVCMVMYGLVCVCMIMYGHAWSCMGMYGHVWSFMGLYGLVRLYEPYCTAPHCLVGSCSALDSFFLALKSPKRSYMVIYG